MEIAQLRYFVALVDTGSMTRAARRVHISQPAVSLALRQLEDELGVALYERQGRGLRITADGLRFYRRARAILDEYRAAKSELRETAYGRPARLGVLRTLPPHWIAGITRRVADSGGPPLQILEGTPPELAEWLRQQRVDAVFSDIALNGTRPCQQPVQRDRFVAIVPVPHALAGQSSIDLMDLHDQAYVLRTHCEALPEGNEIFKAKAVRPNIVCRTGRDALAVALVESGFGVTVLPECLAAGEVKVLPIRDFARERQLGIEWSDAADARFIDILIQATEPEASRAPA
ncbi:LysR family transcriptional regulator [Ectothiorhodospiraceae bacterium WFHF3C12]|nr:LysR family transcriptional regulator [Ectothiorhodospiraceae bacterium WFHF3C12]